MRRSVIAVMSGVSVAVVGLSLRGIGEVRLATLAAAPAGIVTPTSAPVRTVLRSTARTSPTAAATAPPQVHPRVAARPTPSARPIAAKVTASKAPRPSPTPRTITVNGAPADTRYGPVQVQITITNGRITRADAIDYPQSSGRDQEINSQAIPQLDDETVQAQSANIDTVSGATYTSDGYRQSLQSALDAAHAG